MITLHPQSALFPCNELVLTSELTQRICRTARPTISYRDISGMVWFMLCPSCWPVLQLPLAMRIVVGLDAAKSAGRRYIATFRLLARPFAPWSALHLSPKGAPATPPPPGLAGQSSPCFSAGGCPRQRVRPNPARWRTPRVSAYAEVNPIDAFPPRRSGDDQWPPQLHYRLQFLLHRQSGGMTIAAVNRIYRVWCAAFRSTRTRE